LEQDLRTILYCSGNSKIIPKGTILISGDEPRDVMFFVKKGILGISAQNHSNSDEFMALMCMPNSMADDGKFALDMRLPLNVTALERSEVVQFSPKTIIDQNYRNGKRVLKKFQNYSTSCMLCAKKALNVITFFNAEIRLKYLFSSICAVQEYAPDNGFYTLDVKISRVMFAKAVHVTTMTMDRIFGEWMKKRVLKRDSAAYLQIESEFIADTILDLANI
jgi:CRP-like cAMP-binding protein